MLGREKGGGACRWERCWPATRHTSGFWDDRPHCSSFVKTCSVYNGYAGKWKWGKDLLFRPNSEKTTADSCLKETEHEQRFAQNRTSDVCVTTKALDLPFLLNAPNSLFTIMRSWFLMGKATFARRTSSIKLGSRLLFWYFLKSSLRATECFK